MPLVALFPFTSNSLLSSHSNFMILVLPVKVNLDLRQNYSFDATTVAVLA